MFCPAFSQCFIINPDPRHKLNDTFDQILTPLFPLCCTLPLKVVDSLNAYSVKFS